MGLLLFLLQAGLFGYILLSGRIFAQNLFLLFIQGFALFYFFWAYTTLASKTKISAFVSVPKGGKFVRSGPYTTLRHPMYAAILLIGLVLLIDLYTQDRFVAWIALLIILLIKLNIEEVILKRKFKEYKTYMKQTKSLIPRIY